MESIQSSFAGQLSQYQDILSVGYHIFENQHIRIRGTKEDPLFNCLDVIKAIGYKQANDNKFYQVNKSNPLLIIGITNSQAPIINPGQSVVNQHSDLQNYFTEYGLYECLFASDSKIAKRFRYEVVNLLKNLRLGILQIHIQRADVLQNQLTESLLDREAIKDQLLKNSIALQECQQLLSKAEQEIIIYSIKDKNGKEYRGQCLNFSNRLNQHKRDSCNPGVRRAMSEGGCNAKIIERVRCLSRDDIKYAEAKAILAVPQDQRLNVRIPRFDLNNVTLTIDDQEEPVASSQQNIEESKEESKEELPAINERDTEFTYDIESIIDQKPQLLRNAMQQVERLAEYLKKTKGCYPNRRSTDDEEHEMAILVARIRKEMKGQLKTAVTERRIQYVKQCIPDFKLDGIDIKFEKSVATLKKFFADHKRIPHYGGPEPKEKTIYGIMQRIKQAYQENDDYLTTERIALIRQELPFIELESKVLAEFAEKVQLLQTFHQDHQRIPLKRIESESQMHTLYYSIKDQLTSRDKYQEQKKAIVKQIYPHLLQ